MINRLSLILSLCICLFSASALAPSENKVELILQIPATNDKNIDEIKDYLIIEQGFEFNGYCSDHQLFCFRVSPEIMEGNKLEEIMKKGLPEFEFHIKHQTGLQQVKEICSEIQYK